MRRHDLILLNRNAAPLNIHCCTSKHASAHIHRWITQGRPFVFPRQNSCSERVMLGLAFIDAGVKHRSSFTANRNDIVRVDAPYELAECLSLFKASDAKVLVELITHLAQKNLRLRVFGSVSWEKVSGEIYRTATSDLDVLCDVSNMTELKFMVSEFQQSENQLSFPLDGEWRFPNNDCVNWREAIRVIEGVQPTVLIKSESECRLAEIDSLFHITPSPATFWLFDNTCIAAVKLH